MEEIINKKHEELNKEQKLDDRFIKILNFEGNAIGQIGEIFVKQIFREFNIPIKDIGKDIIHDEYDIMSGNYKIEIKTARKGRKNNNFQFNGINPVYNHDFIILIGLTTNKIYYQIIDGKVSYNHKNRKSYLTVNNRKRQLVSMNPGNTVNYKLTLTVNALKEINTFVDDLKLLFNN
ncbi:MAG: restriction endonuclease [Clostridia bacterium]|nr:restriction endonuclease [Clostridia bacterium]